VIRQELEREKGIRLTLRTVEREVSHLRRELEAEAQATIRFETPPGNRLLQLPPMETKGSSNTPNVYIVAYSPHGNQLLPPPITTSRVSGPLIPARFLAR
jgi:hypothetical protein